MSEKISKAWNANGQEESDGMLPSSHKEQRLQKAESKISKATSILKKIMMKVRDGWFIAKKKFKWKNLG